MARKAAHAQQGYKTETVEEYLARGGKITICPPGARSTDEDGAANPWAKRKRGKPKAKAAAKAKSKKN